MHGEIRTRARTGCLTCRRRHYKCDERRPTCVNCARSRIMCKWNTISPSVTTSTSPMEHSSSVGASTEIVYYEEEFHKYFPSSSAQDEHSPGSDGSLQHQNQLLLPEAISTREIETITFYMSNFHIYNYQLCEWTAPVALPRRTTIPNIISIERRGVRKMTSWASYYLPHLSLGNSNDCLTLAISAFTARRMGDVIKGAKLYVKALLVLRQTLSHKDVSSTSGMDFLRIWATTLLLTEYESHDGNHEAGYRHLEGATVLSSIAASRFSINDTSQSKQPHSKPGSTTGASSCRSSPESDFVESSSAQSSKRLKRLPDTESKFAASATDQTGSVTSTGGSKTENELPGYLTSLTQRLNTSKMVRAALDTAWPKIVSPIERDGLGALHELCNEGYRLLFPLVTAFYTRMEAFPPRSPQEYEEFMAELKPSVDSVLQLLDDYQIKLLEYYQGDLQIYQSCARHGFPFSPVIKFANPMMVQPVIMPHILLLFMAPFITAAKHAETVRHITGISAGFQGNPGLMLDAAWPDIHVAAFWRKGEERDYFEDEFHRRGGDFAIVLGKIWSAIDMLEIERKRLLTPTEILGVSLKGYRTALHAGMQLKTTRH